MTSTEITTGKPNTPVRIWPFTRLKLRRIAYQQYLLLAAITIAATALRFYKLGQWSFWIDEIFTIQRAQAHVNLETILAQWWHPSLSVILTGVTLKLLGVSEWTARLVAAVIGILSILILYFPIRKLWGTGVALTFALLLAVAPWHLYWSQNARYFTSLLLLYTLALLAFFLAIERDRPGYVLLFFLFAVLALGERFYALFLAPVVVSYLLLLKLLPFEKPPGFRPRNVLLILLPGLVIVLIDLFRLLITGYSYLLASLELSTIAPIDDPFRLGAAVIFQIGIPLVVVALFSAAGLLRQKSRAGLFLLLGAVVPLLLLAVLNLFVFTVDRYVFMTLPSWIILAAMGVQRLYAQPESATRLMAAAILAVLLAHAAGDHLLYYQINHGNRPDWRSAFAYVQSRRGDGDVIVSSVPDVGSYYTGETVIGLGDIEPDKIAAGDQQYWFVVDSENGWWAGEKKQWVETHSDLVYFSYLRVRENIHLQVHRYDPNNPYNP